jgi:hypothetical protein
MNSLKLLEEIPSPKEKEMELDLDMCIMPLSHPLYGTPWVTL